jgi:hypothetical protein
MSWLASLPPNTRTRVLAAMREISARYTRAYEEHREHVRAIGQRVPVGGAHMDSFFRSEALRTFLDSLNAGSTPDQACEHAREAVALAVTKWSDSRGDYHVHRWTGTEGDTIDSAHREILCASAT